MNYGSETQLDKMNMMLSKSGGSKVDVIFGFLIWPNLVHSRALIPVGHYKILNRISVELRIA